MATEYHKGRELTMEVLGLSLEELRGQPLELFAREGARLLLTVGLETEVVEFLKRKWYERSQGETRGYRNGHRERRLMCAAGEVSVAVPRVADTVEAFRSRLVKAWERRSRAIEEVLPLLYVEGLSTRDFKRALKPLWGESGLSRSSISRANQALKASPSAEGPALRDGGNGISPGRTSCICSLMAFIWGCARAVVKRRPCS